jgi:hypothetical protein
MILGNVVYAHWDAIAALGEWTGAALKALRLFSVIVQSKAAVQSSPVRLSIAAKNPG